jgi:DegV family protein with EDD domain
MPRPSVLVVDPVVARRRSLSRGLTGFGYEVVPAVDAKQGKLFLAELAPDVVVAPVGLLDSAGALGPAAAGAGAARRALLLLGHSEEEGLDLPEDVFFLAVDGLRSEDLVFRVHLLLLGREVGIEPDTRLESLVGDLSLVPMLELLRGLQREVVTGRLVHAKGEIRLDAGEVVSAAAGLARGIKAFSRLGLLDAGPVRVTIAPLSADGRPAASGDGGEREITGDLTSLIIRALEDRVHDAPEARVLARIELGPALFGATFTPQQKELLAAVPACRTVGRLLDALPALDGEILRDLLSLAERGIVVLEEPEAPVRVVTDSTSDLSADLARAHGIEVVPLLVFFGEQAFHDGIDLRPREFYDRLEAGPHHPRTNPPLKGDFLKVYRQVAGPHDVVSIHLSEKLSQTLVHARAAAAEALPGLAGRRAEGERPVKLELVDSQNVSLGLGLLALFAARMARRKLEPEAIARRLAEMRPRLHVLFVVDTLDYLARGGRIGKARALVGNLLGIKPILGVVDGEVVAVDRVRGGRAAHPRLIELWRERVDSRKPVVAGIAHAKAPVWADRLRLLIEESFQVSELLITEMGPVVGTHAGPGAVGAVLFQPTADELPLIAPLPADSADGAGDGDGARDAPMRPLRTARA